MTRDRVKELRRVRAGDLQPHPHNWRTHGRYQQDVLRGVLSEVGYADALVARELSDGSLQLIDGHLRAETTPNMVVPVLIVDLDDAEAEKALLTHDPLGALAGADPGRLTELIERLDSDNRAINEMLSKVQGDADVAAEQALHEPLAVGIPESFQVVVECDNEQQQQAVFERMTREGHRCRVLTL